MHGEFRSHAAIHTTQNTDLERSTKASEFDDVIDGGRFKDQDKVSESNRDAPREMSPNSMRSNLTVSETVETRRKLLRAEELGHLLHFADMCERVGSFEGMQALVTDCRFTMAV
jgi:hypothetical protein